MTTSRVVYGRSTSLPHNIAVARAIYAKLVAWWEGNETSGTVAIDSHINGLHGTYTGVTLNQAPLASNLGASWQTTGSGNVMSVPDNALLKPTGNLACMAWFKRNGGQPSFGKIFWKPTNLSNGNSTFILQHDNGSNGGKCMFRTTCSGTNFETLSTSALADLTTYCLIGSRLRGNHNLWVNGVRTNSPSGLGQTSTVDTAALALVSGTSGSGDAPIGWHGPRAVFNDGFTDEEALFLYAVGTYANLKATAGY